MRATLFLRSFAFWSVFTLSIVIYAPLSLLTIPLPFAVRYRFINVWTRFNIWWLKHTCKLTYQVEGREHLPPGNAVVMVKHQSTWETLSMQVIFPIQTWIAKRELLWVPFFGWSLALLEPIALDRKAGQQALNQLVQQGTKRLQQGRWIIVFPEGTRVAPGQTGQYQPGGAMLAARSGYPVVPVAHNAGEFWPRRSFLKYPGTIRVVIGPVIETRNRSAREILADTEQWIETTMANISAGKNIPK
ncbi:MAG: lysophospholipid acyltransferase family protein [Gammaproteobacteria bacterium]